MSHNILVSSTRTLILAVAFWYGTLIASAQSTAFTYQGQLNDGGSPATGSYDLQFKLFDALTVGTQVGSVSLPNVSVSNGVFTVTLDFGASAFPGANRWLEISVRLAGSGTYTTLTPRQPLTSTPYAIKSLSATAADGLSAACVGCVSGTQIGALPGGSGNYVQNTTTQQTASNFNISGTGTAGILNAATQFNLGGSRLISAGPPTGSNNFLAGLNAGDALMNGRENTFMGSGAGQATTGGNQLCTNCGPGGTPIYYGSHNTFTGYRAGFSNTTGNFNSFFGTQSGSSNMAGSQNSFFGTQSGASNTTGGNNSFVGSAAGYSNTTGYGNSFVGSFAGYSNTTGIRNSYFGHLAGYSNTTGSVNSFFGNDAGFSNTTGEYNSFVGTTAGYSNTTGTRNSYFGHAAGFSNTTGGDNSFLGYAAGLNNTTGMRNSLFGDSTGFWNTTGFDNSFFGYFAGGSNTTGGNNSFFGSSAGNHNTIGKRNLMFGTSADFRSAAAFSAGAVAGDENLFVGYQAGGDSARRNAAAIGANAFVACDDCMVLGNSAVSTYNVGIGITAPQQVLHVNGANEILSTGSGSGFKFRDRGSSLSTDDWVWYSVGNIARFNRGGANDLLGITTDGKVGIGTIAPATKLDAAGTIRSTAQTIPTSGEGLEVIYYNGQGYLTSYNRTDSLYKPLNLEGSVLSLNVGSGGNVGIGGVPTATQGVRLQVAGNIRVGIGTIGCVMDANGDVIAGTCSSDLRFKQNITPFPNLLHKITRLQPVHFYWRTEAFPSRHFGSEQSYGLIAQEVEEVLPELVTKDGEGYRAVNYSKLPLMMLQAIKEMKAEQDTLKQQNTALQQQNATLQTRLATLERMMQRLAEQAEKPTPKQR